MDALRLLVAFSIVFGLLGIFWILIKLQKGTSVHLWGASIAKRPFDGGRADVIPTGSLSIIRQVRLTPTHQLHLIGTGRERFLVCTYPQGCTPISLQIADSDRSLPAEWRDKGLNDAA
jgi:hypothetical protein